MLGFTETSTGITVSLKGKFWGFLSGRAREFYFARGSSLTVGATANELRILADKMEQVQGKEAVSTTLKFIPTWIGMVVKKRGEAGYVGRISTDGRWPGRWTSSSAEYRLSPAEMMEIAKKCAEVKNQIESVRNLRKNLCK